MRVDRGDPLDRWISVRPLALVTGCFLAGVIVGRAAGPMPLVWGALAVAAAALLAALRKRALAFSLALMLGALHVSLFMLKPDVCGADDARLTGYVDAEPRRTEKYVRVRLNGVAIDGERLPCRVMLYLYDAEDEPSVGDCVSVTADTWTPRGAGNPGGFDYDAWLWRQRVALCASAGAEDALIEPPRGFSLARLIQAARHRVAEGVSRMFSPESAGVALALITGDRSGMDETVRDNYRAAGVSHLLALSGLHVSVLLGGLEWLLRKLRLSRKASFFLTLPAAALYALLVGLPASVLRACLMHAAVGFARLDGRPRDGLSIICLSMLPLLLVNPLYVEDAGFVLSYAAVTGLTLFARRRPDRGAYRPVSPLMRAIAALGRAMRMSLAAQLGALPAAVCLFNQLPLWFLPFNVALAPLMALLFPLLLAATALGMLCPPLMSALAWLPERIVSLFNAVTAWGARMPLALINAADWPAWLIALYAAAAFCVSPYVRFTRSGPRRAAAVSAMAAVIALGLALPCFASREGLAITFVDVGQGDGAVVRAQGHTYLIDTGGGSDMAEYLLNQGLEPEGIFLSHGHSDHAAGLGPILDAFSPCPIYVSCQWDSDPMDEAVALVWQKALAAGWPVARLSAGDEVMLSDAVALRVWHPGAASAGGANENSMVCSVRYGQSAALFTGDLPMSQEFMPLPDCTVLKVGHHGSKRSTGAVLLDQVTPAVAIISVGHNSFGHPAPEVLERLKHAAVFRTDERGAITVVMEENGQTRVTTWLPEAIK